MGLRAASTSVSSYSSASENISLIQQRNTHSEEIILKLKDIKEEDTLDRGHPEKYILQTCLSGITQLKKNLKVISNVSSQSNMAPALTEPLSPANKLSSSAISASPQPVINSQVSVNNNFSLTDVNGDNDNLVDIETELLRAVESSASSGSGAGSNNRKTQSAARIYSSGFLKSNGVSSKGAFQSAFEEVVAKQSLKDTVTSSASSLNNKNLFDSSKQTTILNKIFIEKPQRSIASRERFSRQMGPMCDTNNLTKPQLLEIKNESNNSVSQIIIDDFKGGSETSPKLEKVYKETKDFTDTKKLHMDLINYDINEDSQQDNIQVEIHSSSSTVTAENTDIEDNINFSEDVGADREYETIVVNNEEMHRCRTTVAQELFGKLQRTPSCISSSAVSSSQTLEQQQSQNQIQTIPVCSLTPQSTGSVGGLSSQKDFIKDSAEMDQVLGDMDLLQVLKGFDSAPGSENLCDLAGSLGLFNDVDVMNYEEMGMPAKDCETREIRTEIEKRQQQMQRKCDFLLRRLRKIQARYMGRHASEEVAGLFEWTNRIVRRKKREHINRQILYEEDKRRPVSTTSMKAFLKRLNVAATIQHSKSDKVEAKTLASLPPSITLSSCSESNKMEMSTIISTYDEKTAEDIGHVSGMLQTEMKEVQSGIDSDVTASSSGGESADEMVTYNNQLQQSLSISKRAAWRWARDRAAIAARWTWLLAQVSDLEYRIRQHNELHHQIKKSKGAVAFEKNIANYSSSSTSTTSLSISNQPQPNCPPSSVNGYRGLLPGNPKTLDTDNNLPNGAYESNSFQGACRTRPFLRTGFRKRKLLQTANVHTISKKAARSSTIKCGCQWPLHPCALCTGRSDPTAPRDLPDTMTIFDRVALVDPGFHPVLSFSEDVASSIHFEATMRLSEWQNRVLRPPSKTLKGSVTATGTQKAAERGEDRSNKKLVESRRKQNRKHAQESGPANKLNYAKARRALHGSQFNNSHHPQNIKNSSKHRKISSSAGGNGVGSEFQEGNTGSIGTNSSSGVTGSSDGGVDTNDCINGSHHLSRSKNSSPTPGNHSFSYKSERFDRKNRNSYDIDNIVIPYSVAATTRVEILPYKEIPTPKWRIIEDDNLESEKCDQSIANDDEESEDISELAIQIRHERALLEERKKFQTYLKFPWSTRSRANRRIDSRAESSGANTPDPTSPASSTPNAAGDHESIPSPANPPTPQTPAESADGGDNHINIQNSVTPFLNSMHRKGERRRTVSSKKDASKEDQRRSSSPDGRDMIPSFEPLEFPLSDEKYESMLQMMPNDHNLLLEDCSKTNCDPNVKIVTGTITDNTSGIVECDGRDSGLSTTKVCGDIISAFDTGESLMGCDSDTDSAESGLQDEDPNDPEWREPA